MDELRHGKLNGFAGACPDDCQELPARRLRIVVIVRMEPERPYVCWFGTNWRTFKESYGTVLEFTRVPRRYLRGKRLPIEKFVAILIGAFRLGRNFGKGTPLANSLEHWRKARQEGRGPEAQALLPQLSVGHFIDRMFDSEADSHVLRHGAENICEVTVLDAECLHHHSERFAGLTEEQDLKTPIRVVFQSGDQHADSITGVRSQYGLSDHDLLTCYELLGMGRVKRSAKGAPRDEGKWLDRVQVVYGENGLIREPGQYKHIDELFVKPSEYSRVLELLDSKGIVFILGPPHFGKSFLAAHLLRRYSGRPHNRTPYWLFPKRLEREPEPGRLWPQISAEPDEPLVDLITKHTGKGIVTFIEDPFGHFTRDEVGWHRLDPANLVCEAARYALKHSQDVRIIVTSRDTIFDEAVQDAAELQPLIVRLGRPTDRGNYGSYGPKRIKDLLDNYGHLYHCKWCREKMRYVLSIHVAQKLETPQAVALFCRFSQSAKTELECTDGIGKAARELENAFVAEIAAYDSPTLACALIAGCSAHVADSYRYDCAETSRLRDVLGTLFPDMTGTELDTAIAQASTSLAHRVHWSEHRGATVAYQSYLRALDAMLARTPAIQRKVIDMAATLADSADPKMKEMSAVLTSKIVAMGLGEESMSVVRDLLRMESFFGSNVAGLLGESMVRDWDRLNDGLRQELETASFESRDLGMKVASTMGIRFNRLDERGRQLLQRFVTGGGTRMREFSALGLAVHSHDLPTAGARLLDTLGDDREASVLVMLIQGLESSLAEEGGLAARDLAILHKLVKHTDETVRKLARRALDEVTEGRDESSQCDP